MTRFVDLTGQRFGRLVVVERLSNDKHHHARWRVRCDCGQERVCGGWDLSKGRQKSCGCLSRELSRDRGRDLVRELARQNTTHGMTHSLEYRTWRNMIDRCERHANKSFADYGGRGITVCDEWRHDFMAFYAHVGPRPGPEYSVDRIDPNGNYEPGNVRWATRSQQSANQRPRRRRAA